MPIAPCCLFLTLRTRLFRKHQNPPEVRCQRNSELEVMFTVHAGGDAFTIPYALDDASTGSEFMQRPSPFNVEFLAFVSYHKCQQQDRVCDIPTR